LTITKDERLACSHSQAIQGFWSRGIFGTLSRLESAPKPKSAYGTGSVQLGSEPASTMAPSRFRVGVAATLIVVGNHYVQITKRDVHVTHELADLLPYTSIQISYVIYRPLDLPQSTWHSPRSWQRSAVTSVSSSFLPCSLCSFSSLRFQRSRRYHPIPFPPLLPHH